MVKKFDEYINELWYKGVRRSQTGNMRKEDIVYPKTSDELQEIITKEIKEHKDDEAVNLNFIDTSMITNMIYLFDDVSGFFSGNVDVSQWDVSHVENMSGLFYGLNNFDCDLSRWNVSKVRDFFNMFRNCQKFKGDGLSRWNVSSARNMGGMFCNCEHFNCDLSRWNVSNVVNMGSMFYNCEHFNSDLSRWDVSNVDNITGMFYTCRNFDSNIDGWDVSNIKDEYMLYAFDGCGTTPSWLHKS